VTETVPGPATFREALVPPQALDAERSVLAALLLDAEAIGRAVETIQPEVFYRTGHQKIYEAIVALYERNEKPDLVTLAEELRKRGELEAVGGPPALAQILDYATTTANLDHHIRIIHSKSILRQLIHASNEIQQEAYAGGDETPVILDRAEQRIFSITDQRVRQGFVLVRDLLKPSFEHIQKMFERQALVTGVPTGFSDLDELTAGFQNSDLIIIAGRPGMGKCLTGRTLLDDPATGERLTIEECVRRRMPAVLGVSEDGCVRATAVTDWMDNGVKPCFRLTTRLGRSLEATGQHPFLTVEGWAPLSGLAPGRCVALPRAVPVFGTDDSWSLERVRLLAYFIAEGGLTGLCPRFTNLDPVLVGDFHRCLRREFPTCVANDEGRGQSYRVARHPRHRHGTAWGGVAVNPVTQWLRELGLMGKLSAEKSIPAVLWTMPRTHLGEFLRILFSCDATIYPIEGMQRIEFTVASEALAAEVQHALCRFRIIAKFWRKTERSWRVEITDPVSVDAYQREIGWKGEKAARFPRRIRAQRERRAYRGHPPVETWELVRTASAGQGLTLSEVARRAGEPVGRGFNPHTGRPISSPRLVGMAAVLEDPRLELAASAELYWDEIVSIEPIGMHRVFDLTVPDGANFIANDVCVHNSAIALNFAENAAIPTAKHDRVPVAVFSLEMSKEQLAQRLLCSQGGINLHRVRSGRLTNEDWPRLTTAAGLLNDAPILIDDSPSPSLMEIRAKCRRLRAENKLGLLIIDYLQLIRSSGHVENRVQEISQITRGLKALAKELNIPILALSQLSRAVETRDKTGRPQLSDLRESGSIEQDADLVLFVYREIIYNEDAEPNKAELLIAKQRNGPTGNVKLTFLRESTKFVPYSPTFEGETQPEF
jgi:replicative DNA helicase